MNLVQKASLAVIGSMLFASGAFAHDDHARIAGPNGGRVITSVEPHLEFFVTEDKKVRITAVNCDKETKIVPIETQSVAVIAGKRLSPTRLAFEKEGDTLVSTGALPKGMNLPVVVQIKPDADSKTVLEKFQLNLEDCPTCDFKEYACTCDHAHSHEGHKHD